MGTGVAATIRPRTQSLEALVPAGQSFVAVSLVAFGIQQFLWGDFVPGRALPWPEGVPGRLVWAYLSGAGLIATGAAILLAIAQPSTTVVRTARIAAVCIGAVILLWAGVRHLPAVAADAWLGGEWTRLGKALMLFGGTLAVAGALPRSGGSHAGVARVSEATEALIYTGRVCLGAFFILCGVQHFIWTEFVASLVPAWIPGPFFWTYFAGIALIAGGAGMLFPPTASLAARLSALMVFLWVLMLHIPRAVTALEAASSQSEWMAVFEALAVSGIALAVAVLPSRGR